MKKRSTWQRGGLFIKEEETDEEEEHRVKRRILHKRGGASVKEAVTWLGCWMGTSSVSLITSPSGRTQ